MVHDASMSDVTLKCQDVALKRRGELPILFDYTMSGQPGDGIPSCVLVLKGFLELSKEVVPGSKGDGSAGDCILPESVSPSQDRSFSHVQVGKCDFICISVV